MLSLEDIVDTAAPEPIRIGGKEVCLTGRDVFNLLQVVDYDIAEDMFYEDEDEAFDMAHKILIEAYNILNR